MIKEETENRKEGREGDRRKREKDMNRHLKINKVGERRNEIHVINDETGNRKEGREGDKRRRGKR